MQAISFCAITNRGCVRDNNEDNFYAAGFTPGAEELAEAECMRTGTLGKKGGCKLFAVCDGMGGMNAGEVASAFVVDAFMTCSDKITKSNAEGCAQYLEGFLAEQNEKLYVMSVMREELAGLGTTFVGLCVAGNEAVALNVGDSRCYVLREGKLYRLTIDHSEAERLIRLGVMTPEQARGSRERSMLYRYIGTPPEAGRLECGIAPKVRIQKDDVFLLCSDGLTDMVDDGMIAKILVDARSAEEAARALVDTALQNGGMDNVTAVVVKTGKQKPGKVDRLRHRKVDANHRRGARNSFRKEQ